jgi:hypothetical protein
MGSTRKGARLVPEHCDILLTIPLAVFHAEVRVTVTRLPSTRGAVEDLVAAENTSRLEGALRAVFLADEAPRTIRPPQMARAVYRLIDSAS